MLACAKRRHRRAIVLMVGAATLWSIAGVVTRHLSPELQAEGRFEITFWRSFFAAVFILGYLVLWQREGLQPVRRAGLPGLLSGLMWAIMYSAFMLALTLTTTANTLLVMSVSPLLTAVLAWMVLGTAVPVRTAVAILVATVGMIWMFASGDGGALPSGSHLAGMAIAFAVPLASAINLITLQKVRGERSSASPLAGAPGAETPPGAGLDLVPAVLIGGALSALLMLAMMAATGALPFKAAARDVVLLAVLGFFQLGLPCMLMIRASRHLAAPEIALLALIEVLLGPLWAWLGAGETPGSATLMGGALVLGALVANELAGLRRAKPAVPTTMQRPIQ